MRISTNVQNSVAIRKLGNVNRDLNRQYEKLSSGDRITKAAYDPAGLAITENMKAKIRSMGQAKRNVNDGISFFQMTEGTFHSLQSNAIRLRELAMQAAGTTFGPSERAMIQKEVSVLRTEIARTTKSAILNIFGRKGGSSKFEIQIGIKNDKFEDRLAYDTKEFFDTDSFYGVNKVDVSSATAARSSLATVDAMISKLASGRAKLGSFHKKLIHTHSNLETHELNQSAAKSQIRDTDVAEASAKSAIEKIKLGAATSMFNMTNSSANGVLKLLS